MNGVIAAAASVAVLLGLVTAVLGLLNQQRAGKALQLAEQSAKVATETAGQVQSISVQVDGRLSTLLERQSQLLDALHASGTPVPPKPPEKVP